MSGLFSDKLWTSDNAGKDSSALVRALIEFPLKSSAAPFHRIQAGDLFAAKWI
ncbi:hypothetical protein SAMN06265222_12425 [Neorhodopirellula lusitana]|uniref:Uncharacterized protein n=1 Tax=Neorhodopirellula lusitana TaxID=445327 RepID=A0ABY1QSE4_9BACT|nr:hypothetical protein SAMN06265222_12425 [Neorhodopirellula lusitana]